MDVSDFRKLISEGIPESLPELPPRDSGVSHAPVRKDILDPGEKRMALRNALRYFPPEFHKVLAGEFARELKDFGRIYMYRFKPSYEIKARHFEDYPHRSKAAAAIMLMISNNLDPKVAQHPQELITYGGNGAVFQNWAQYRLVMKYLSLMTDEQTLVIYSGHPLGLFPSHAMAPRVVVTNGLVIPNYSSPDHLERFSSLGVSQYGQMTAGSYMYIGPQGIVHGTTITIMNAARRLTGAGASSRQRKLFVSSGLGGMSGAQPKASKIAGLIAVVAEINPAAAMKRYKQGWVDEVIEGKGDIVSRIKQARDGDELVSLAFLGNIVDLWEALAENDIFVDIGSDQTSLHNPWSGGYYPATVSFEESNTMMVREPGRFRELVRSSLRRQVDAINRHTARGTVFFDYGNAFLLEASRAGADILDSAGSFRYPSYVQSIMGPVCFDFGFGPFRWVCCSNEPSDLAASDRIAAGVLEKMMLTAPAEIKDQLADNLHWIREAGSNNLVVGSQARILYADAAGRISLARALNRAVGEGTLSAPVVIGRDHHDVSGTDSPFRETSDIYDGSSFTADMSVQNVIGDAFRGATWVSLHNGGGVGWGEVINGGFGMLLDGTADTDRKIEMMLHWDVNNGIARRSWAGNQGARLTLGRAMQGNPLLTATLPYEADTEIIEEALGIF
ncbi:MAG: urocanate hydratase [Bacteroidales bacterium]|jgi:urocanate hydratase|nr:urocanate hydratase [Bacteroidales bacterium]